MCSRKSSFNAKGEKNDLRLLRENSVKQRQQNGKEMDSSSMSIGDMSHTFTPMSSVRSFMESSQKSLNSEVDLFFEDTTLKNTFYEFSAIALEDCVYHFGGLTNADTEKYHPDTGNS